MPDDKKKSKLEGIKETSDNLRGNLKENLAEDTDHFPADQSNLLKFHGIYQQDNRDTRNERIKQKQDKEYYMMVRSKFPGGKLSAEQYLLYDEISKTCLGGTIRLTTRQTIQLHGVLKKNLKKTVRQINEKLITTLGACGDVVRNVMASPLPNKDPLKDKVLEYAKNISNRFLPASGAYHEVWLDGEKVSKIEGQSPEPLYGNAYLPRKFKIGIAFDEDNIVDIYTQDIGIVPHIEGEKFLGFTILVGGGLGYTHLMPKTYPRLASPLCFVKPEALEKICEVIITIQRDHGNRSDRKRARMKYLIDEWGLEKFKAEVEKRFGESLSPPKPLSFEKASLENYMGWHRVGENTGYYGISIENGRIKDEGEFCLKSAIKEIVEKYQPEIRLTPSQDMLFCNIPEDAAGDIEGILKNHHVKIPAEITQVRQLSMACPALPLCPLALGEAERVLPRLIDAFEEKLKSLGLDEHKMTIRMTGCPNSCSRPQTAEIAFVGTQPNTYNIYIGGGASGERMNRLYKERIHFDNLVGELDDVLVHFKENRESNESFGDFCQRLDIH